MKLKEGAKIDKVAGPLFFAAIVVEGVFNRYGHECVITAGNDGQHGIHTFHIWGYALDFRTRDVPIAQMMKITIDIKKELGADYDVVQESDHLHVEVSNRWIAANGDPRKAA